MADESSNQGGRQVPRPLPMGIPVPRSGGVPAHSAPAAVAWAAVPSELRRPGVEWAIIWPDGRITVVESEASARLVTSRHPACLPACRLVGAWGPA